MYICINDFYKEGIINKELYKELEGLNIIHNRYGKGIIEKTYPFAGFYYIVIQYKNKKIPKKHEKSNILKDIKIEIENDYFSIYEEIINEIKNNDKYVNMSEFSEWKENHKVKYSIAKLINNQTNYKNKFLNEFISIYESKSNDDINKNFIVKEKMNSKEILENINEVRLDNDQIETIIKDEGRHLVIAGAGCGKTTLICGKVKYLLERYGVKQDEIAIVSFSSKAVDDMKDRLKRLINIDMENVKTLHKMGKDIISVVEKRYVNICDDKDKQNKITEIFNKLLKEDNEFEDLIINYYSKFHYSVEHQEFKNSWEYQKYLRDSGKMITLRGERVRSFDEVEIANYLFINGIRYKYEEPYKFDSNYNPDFYLPDYKIYIEHFGVNEKGEAPIFFDNRDKYVECNKYKEEKHRKNGTKLIITESHYKYKSGITNELYERLLQYNVKIQKISNQEILKAIENNFKYDHLKRLIIRFISDIKSKNINILEFSNKNYKSYPKMSREYIFIKILNKIFTHYDINLKSSNKIDFEDMLNIAIKYVEENKYIKKYKYIIVDEMQDTSVQSVKFIKCFLNINKDSKLICVGDDWQSIYGFNGSDVEVLYKFKDIFLDTYTSYITSTYRFDENLVDISNKFVLKDSKHIIKNVNSKKKEKLEQCILKNNLVDILDKICNIEKGKNITVFLLGRYGTDIEILNEYRQYFRKKYNNRYTYKNNTNIDIKFMTVHKSKGLEADYVVILNCQKSSIKNYMKGFPTEVKDDPLLKILFDQNYDCEHKINRIDDYIKIRNYNCIRNSEERRVFYVAMTRAKKQTYLLVPRDKKDISIYVNEIESIKNKEDLVLELDL